MGSTEEDLRRDPRGPRRPGRGVSWRGRGGRSREARGLEEWREVFAEELGCEWIEDLGTFHRQAFI